MKEVSLYIDAAGAGTPPEGWYVRDRIKKQRLYYIRGGKGFTHDALGNRIPFEAGKIYIHPFNLVAEYESDPREPIDHIYFDFISTPPIIASAPLIYEILPGSAVRYTLEAFESVLADLKDKQMLAGDAISANLLEGEEYGPVVRQILQLLLGELSLMRAIPFAADKVVCETLEYIRLHYKEEISVKELAGKAGFEVNYFIRYFKNIMGMTPYAYLRSYRLLRAGELRSKGLTLTETADLVGYRDATSLSRALRDTAAEK